MQQPDDFRSRCAVASALDLIGDRWSLIIIRSLFVGHSRYGEFLKDPEGISTNILADRLRQLECAQLIERRPGPEAGGHARYRLTRKGADLLPALQALAHWGFQHIADRWQPPDWFLNAKPSDYYPPET
jgi:DNA-binding HxlR family transcriptional regulator